VSEAERFTYVIGLGANLGDRVASLASAVDRLTAVPEITLLGSSRLRETEALTLPGASVQPRYLNAAVRVTSTLEPEVMLARCLGVEAGLGRERRERWGPRTIDLDVLLGIDAAGAILSLDTGTLTLPHPALLDRAFALGPLLEVAPELEERWGERLRELGEVGVSIEDPRWPEPSR